MEENVLLYEPHLALFVQDDDPLLFYRAILSKAMHALNPEGMVAVEINERYGPEVTRLFHEHRFSSTAIHMDISGKDRIVYGFMESS